MERLTNLLQQILRHEDLQTSIRSAIVGLQSSHLIMFLRERAKARPQSTENVNYLVMEAIESGRSRGYSEAIDDIEYFFEQYVYPLQGKAASPIVDMRIAVIDKLYAEGKYSKEEAEKLKKDIANGKLN